VSVMLCEKCQERSATVHFTQKIRGGEGEPFGTEVTHHFCEPCSREFMQNSPEFKGASFSKPTLRTELLREPDPNLPPVPQIDTSKRYDVYCMEPDRGIVVYRNALFKGSAALLPSSSGRVLHPDFVELEQANGQSIFVMRGSIFRLCAPGTVLVGEVVRANRPDVK
ncbi:MAG TPA: hypothetical protein VEC99_17530, partial [Clostridia bacterium]|nr:hypothetical protein [Clostridia bacterium]